MFTYLSSLKWFQNDTEPEYYFYTDHFNLSCHLNLASETFNNI